MKCLPSFMYHADEIPRKKFQPDLTVRDAQGRRRFHGAFTGGFSAGFFNTVGTKEVAKTHFMSLVAVKRRKMLFFIGNLQIARHQSIGIKLLNQMGWRQGQGIGEHIKRAKPKQQPEAPAGAKVYGCALPPGTQSSDEEDELAAQHTFAPADVDDVLYVPKNNQHGIGYVPLDQHSVLSAPIDVDQPTTTKCHLGKGKRKLAITGQAFGVGAFEEEDGDIYAREDMSQYSFEVADELDEKPRKSLPAIEGPKSKPVHDRSKALEGFHLAKEPPTVMKLYPPPKIPADFKPFHEPPKRERRRFEEPKSDLYKDKITEHSGSIFDLVSPADRERLESIKKGGSGERPKEAQRDASVPQPSQAAAQAAPAATKPPVPVSLPVPGQPTKPFARDEAKQKRFEQYLSLQGSNRLEVFPAMQPLSMTEWEKERERKEFQRAALICQPSQGLESRFVSTRTLKDEDDVIDITVDKAEETADAAKAAQLGMFGKLTHDEFEWHPVDLLCRRFNVPNPYPNCGKVGLATVTVDKHSIFNFLTPSAQEDEPPKDSGNGEGDEPVAESAAPDTKTSIAAAELEAGKTEEDSSEEEEEERPSLAFFKSIFSESSEDEDEKPEAGESASKVPTAAAGSEARATEESPVQVVKPPPRPALGVFANLDFERLNQRPPPVPLEDLQPAPVSSRVDGALPGGGTSPQHKQEDSSMYGPKLPPGGTCLVDTKPPGPGAGVLAETSMASSKVSEGEVSVATLFVLEAAATALDIAATAVTTGAAFCCFADARDGARSSLIWTELVLELVLEALGAALEEGVAAEATGATFCC
ncbi:hypothetical protein HPB48_002297 [Haemaphysalis longicornis]|uniref:G-patch domain-containing protein n=1 Tax=Haemaphysalis longicornis TaxID=44386 RepID=A0A9J6FHN1_HAELO|nr:hypothetical protein HPB48_002297 [Haemaphysalis longicornis]